MVWDTTHCKIVRQFEGHLDRVSSVSWNGTILSTGSRDRMIYSRDLRVAKQFTHKHFGHKQEVCGLKWSFDGS
jgi:cell division cycle 20-like protein 1 (cofactor of APC complex)